MSTGRFETIVGNLAIESTAIKVKMSVDKISQTGVFYCVSTDFQESSWSQVRHTNAAPAEVVNKIHLPMFTQSDTQQALFGNKG